MFIFYYILGIVRFGEGCFDEINIFIVIDGFDEFVLFFGKV